LPELPRRGRVPRGRAVHRMPELPLPLPGPRRHPGHVDRGGREAVRLTLSLADRVIDLDDASALAGADPSSMLGAVLRLPEDCERGYEVGRAVQKVPSGDGL